MIRNARNSLNIAKRHLQPSSSGVRLVSTTSADKVASSRPLPPPPSQVGDTSQPRNAPAKNPRRANSYEKGRVERVRPRRERVPDDEGQPTKHLLKPHQVSAKVHKICKDGKVEDAVEYVQNLPSDALNIAVWNTLIMCAGQEKKYRLAHQVYIDMKRRRFIPNLATYTTLMKVYSKIQNWATHHKRLETVHKVYTQFLEYLAAVRETNPQSPEISPNPVNIYIAILGRAGDYQRLFDVYNSLDDDGPFSPNHFTYTSMFKAMYRYGMAEHRRDEVLDPEEAQKLRERAASDARLVWRQVLKRIEGGANLTIDAGVIASILEVLALGRPADHIAAFDIAREYLGLAKPGETAPPALVELTPPLVQDVLWLCNRAQKHRLCVHFVQQLMERQPEVLDRGHFDHVLTAYGSLSALGSLGEASRALQALEWLLERELTTKDGYRLRPGLPTFTLALMVCWRAQDWESALRTFELMTGLSGSAFADDATDKPQAAPRSTGRNLKPDAAAMSCLVRTALESKDRAAMRQCARIVSHLGVATFLTEPAEDDKLGMRTGARFSQDRTFYTHKAARAVQELIDALIPKKTESSPKLTAEEREWVRVRSEARTFLIEQREHRPQSTPELEETPLGSAAGLAAMDSVVEWDMVQREQKSAR